MLVIAEEWPGRADVAALLDAADTESAVRYPAESRRGVGLDVLERADCRFLVAREDGVAIGCGGLLLSSDHTGEIKRMFVAAPARCRGVARRLLDALEEIARRERLSTLRLETGIASHAALAVYRRLGWQECERFGAHAADPLSLFMQKRL